MDDDGSDMESDEDFNSDESEPESEDEDFGSGDDEVVRELPQPRLAPAAEERPCLKDVLYAAYAAGAHTDVKLVLADGSELKAHSLVLVTRSEVFAKLLDSASTMAVPDRSAVAVKPDVDRETMSSLLSFLYTDVVRQRRAERREVPDSSARLAARTGGLGFSRLKFFAIVR